MSQAEELRLEAEGLVELRKEVQSKELFFKLTEWIYEARRKMHELKRDEIPVIGEILPDVMERVLERSRH